MDNEGMFVIKRDGSHQPVHFDKITRRISHMCYDLDIRIDPIKIAQEVITRVKSGITTSELDVLTADFCASKISEHPDYNKLASRIIIDNHQKNCAKTFKEACHILYNNKDQLNNHSPLINDIVYKTSPNYDNIIQHDRDFLLDYFGFKTLQHSYLLRVNDICIETPQYMFLRVSIGIHGNNYEKVKETYNLLSRKYFTHATPTLFNSGTPRPQLSSCFLLDGSDDSIEGIYGTITDCAYISKWSGGIGVHISGIRGNGSYISGTGGKSDGIVPMMKVYNDTARYINQGGGKRNGSFAMYIEPWHIDIMDFLNCKKNHGDEERRARDLFYALWIPDLFMERVFSGGDWCLMCPSECPNLNNVYGDEFNELYRKYELEGRYRRKIKASDIWNEIIDSQIETGTPYMLYKDAANNKSNHKNIGTIKSSNLCVVPDTKILTKKGYYKIKDLENTNVTIWNGFEWSNTLVQKTGINQEIIKVKTSDGNIIECTKYHKFYIEQSSRPYDKSKPIKIDAKDLKKGMKLIKHNLPIIDNSVEFPYSYTHGLFCADGTYQYNKYGLHKKVGKITLYGNKKKLINNIDIKTTSGKETANGAINIMLPLDIPEKFEVPINYSLESKLRWLEGFMDGDGTIAINGKNQSLQATSIHKEFLINIMYMLQTMGINSKVTQNRENRKVKLPDGNGGVKEYDCKATFRILISSVNLVKLIDLGFSPQRLNININNPNRNASQFIKIEDVIDEGKISDTYCFTESKRGMGMFNGILTGQCAEIIEYTSSEESSVCNLASICLPMFVNDDRTYNYNHLMDIVKIITYNLNKVIDINYYPTSKSKISNMKNRPIGIGVQGLSDTFNKMRIAYDSPEARIINKNIFEAIYFAALSASCDIAKTDGPYERFNNSPISKGIFQFEMWESWELSSDLNLDWENLRNNIKQYGVRNSLLTALMPTASTSQIMGNSESFEPITSNWYVRRTIAGEFIVLNNYMVNHLLELGLWKSDIINKIIRNKGSIQNIQDIPPDVRNIYKTVWEIKQKVLIDLSADRGRFVDQSQSLNLYFEIPDYETLSKAHRYGWRQGLKTGSYYIRSKPVVNNDSALQEVEIDNIKDCLNCSA